METGSLQSAEVVVPLVLALTRPRSVIDVGCGRGAWLRAFRNGGVKSIRGIDGDYVDAASLLIPQECFSAVDLNKPFELSGRYDLAVCLEVAEHLPAAMANVLVQQLTAVAPLILFSAAITGQGGTNHVNERPPSYWRELFEAHGFMLFDPIRPTILTDSRIEWLLQTEYCCLRGERTDRTFAVTGDAPSTIRSDWYRVGARGHLGTSDNETRLCAYNMPGTVSLVSATAGGHLGRN